MNKNIKNANASIKKNAINLNLDSAIMKKLNAMNLKEISPINQKNDLIYIYPESWGKNEISGLQGKNFRGGLRRKLMNLISLILLFASKKRIEDLSAKISEFNDFYKSNYRINDYSLASISAKKDSEDLQKISLALEIIKNSGLQIKKESPKKDSNKGNKSPKKNPASKSASKENKSSKKDIIKDSASIEIKSEEIKSEESNASKSE